MALPNIESCPRPGLIVPGCFWADPRSVGVTDDEIAADMRGELPAERHEQLLAIARMAYQSLADVIPAGVQPWMTLRRAMS